MSRFAEIFSQTCRGPLFDNHADAVVYRDSVVGDIPMQAMVSAVSVREDDDGHGRRLVHTRTVTINSDPDSTLGGLLVPRNDGKVIISDGSIWTVETHETTSSGLVILHVVLHAAAEVSRAGLRQKGVR